MAEEFWAQEMLFIYKSLLENLSKPWPRRKHYLYYGCCLVAKSCLTLCDAMDCSPPGSSVHGISQARILELVAISFCKGSSPTQELNPVSCIGRWILYHWATHFQGNILSAFWKEKPSPYRKAVLFINIFEKLLWNKNCQWLYSKDVENYEGFNGKLILKTYLCCYCSIFKI